MPNLTPFDFQSDTAGSEYPEATPQRKPGGLTQEEMAKTGWRDFIELLKDRLAIGARGVGEAVRLPQSLGIDAARKLMYGARGIEPNEPNKYSSATMERIGNASSEFMKPIKDMVGSPLEALDAELLKEGHRPAQAAPQGPARVAPGQGPGALPQTATVPVAARTGGSSGIQAPGTQAPDAQEEAGETDAGADDVGGKETGQPQAVAPVPQFSNEYQAAMAKLRRMPQGDLTPMQKKQLQMDFFLNLMARGSKPGSRFLGNLGQAGLDTSAAFTKEQDKNRKQESDALAREREDVNNLFRVKGDDFARGESRRRNLVGEGQTDRRLGMLEQQVKQGAFKVMETPNGYVLYDARTGSTKPVMGADGKPVMPNTKDERPAEIKLLEYLKKNPEALKLLQETKGKGGSGLSDKDLVTSAVKLTGDSLGETSYEDAVKKIRSTFGGATAPQRPANEADAIKQATDAKSKGVPLDQINQRLRAWGYRTIQ